MPAARVLLLSFPLVLLLVLAGGTHAAPDEGGWPFGKGRGPFQMGGGDHQNLGILGAKAMDADAPEPAPGGMGGGMRRGGGRPDREDKGPARLRVTLLLPDGPAAKAGLQVDDVIVGVGRKPFADGSLAPLAKALVKAEAGGAKGIVTLLVERGGDKQSIEIPLPQGGKPYAKPTSGKARDEILRAACTWLSGAQRPTGGFQETMSGMNGAVVMTSLAGLAWLADGSTPKRGPFKDNLRRAVDFVVERVGRDGVEGMPGGMGGMGGGRGSMDQTNWGVAHAAIFLGAVQARAPDRKVKAALVAAADDLVKRQEESGGWAHGPGGPNPLGYVELNIMTGLALMGLGMAQRAGHTISEEALAKAEAYLVASSDGAGGVGYSANAGQKGMGNIGRSAGCWLGYALLGKGKSAFGQKLRKWTTRNIDGVMGGHASLMQHILLAGVAAHALGGKAKKAFWGTLERDLVLARAPDGTFHPRPWHESRTMGSNSDVGVGLVWTTACWAVVLGCEPAGKRPGLPALLGK